jgi:hypothetical protein
MILYTEDLLDMLDQARAIELGVPHVKCNDYHAYDILDEMGPYSVSYFLNDELEYARRKKNAN